jgi:hypothetical protein
MAALAVDGHDDTVLLVSRSWHPPAGLATRIEAFVRGPAAAIGHPVLLASSTSQTDVAGGRLLREPDSSVLAIWERTTSAGTGGNGPSERAEGSLYLP